MVASGIRGPELKSSNQQFLWELLTIINFIEDTKYIEKEAGGEWLWLSWLGGRFQFQRSDVRIQSMAKIYIKH